MTYRRLHSAWWPEGFGRSASTCIAAARGVLGGEPLEARVAEAEHRGDSKDATAEPRPPNLVTGANADRDYGIELGPGGGAEWVEVRKVIKLKG